MAHEVVSNIKLNALKKEDGDVKFRLLCFSLLYLFGELVVSK